MITFALGIPHTPWKPERVKSLARLHGGLVRYTANLVRAVKEFSDREPNWSWSGRMWSWATTTSATHFLSLQDDVEVAPDFWKHLHAMVEARPRDIIGLETAHPLATTVSTPWCSTSDGLIGVGYVVPMPVLREFVEWRATKLEKGGIESITEDTLLDVFAVATGRDVFHPVPTIIDHDTSLPSTYGNDAHGNRRPVATWENRELPASWVGESTHLGRFYGGMVPKLARRWVKGATDADWERWRKT